MKDITLRIVGRQCYDDSEEEQMEFITDGKLYERNEAVYIVYDESKVSGMEGCKTTLKIKGDTMKMRRIGPAAPNTELYFEKGKRMNSLYDTPYGSMDIEVVTRFVHNNLDTEALKGTVDIEYQVSLQGYAEARSRLTVDILG